MSRNSTSILTLTALAAAAWTAGQAITATGAVAGAGANALGIAKDDCDIATLGPVDVLGTAVAIAGAAIAAGAAVEVGAGGQLITHAAGVVVGRAMEAASGAGVSFEVFLIPN